MLYWVGKGKRFSNSEGAELHMVIWLKYSLQLQLKHQGKKLVTR
jgi:hypothetical protein